MPKCRHLARPASSGRRCASPPTSCTHYSPGSRYSTSTRHRSRSPCPGGGRRRSSAAPRDRVARCGSRRWDPAASASTAPVASTGRAVPGVWRLDDPWAVHSVRAGERCSAVSEGGRRRFRRRCGSGRYRGGGRRRRRAWFVRRAWRRRFIDRGRTGRGRCGQERHDGVCPVGRGRGQAGVPGRPARRRRGDHLAGGHVGGGDRVRAVGSTGRALARIEAGAFAGDPDVGTREAFVDDGDVVQGHVAGVRHGVVEDDALTHIEAAVAVGVDPGVPHTEGQTGCGQRGHGCRRRVRAVGRVAALSRRRHVHEVGQRRRALALLDVGRHDERRRRARHVLARVELQVRAGDLDAGRSQHRVVDRDPRGRVARVRHEEGVDDLVSGVDEAGEALVLAQRGRLDDIEAGVLGRDPHGVLAGGLRGRRRRPGRIVRVRHPCPVRRLRSSTARSTSTVTARRARSRSRSRRHRRASSR